MFASLTLNTGVAQRALLRHGHKAHHARGGFLGAADDAFQLVNVGGVQRGVQVGARRP